jgi:hypothetical protein
MRKEIETYQIAVCSSCIIVGKNCLYLQQELSRRDKLQSTLMDNVSPDSVKRVENILEQVGIFLFLAYLRDGTSSQTKNGISSHAVST